MAVYKTKEFSRFACKAGLRNDALSKAAEAVASGRWDANLGGGVFKQRCVRDGGGKSGGFRPIILFRIGGHSFFVHGFAQKNQANITASALRALKAMAGIIMVLAGDTLEPPRQAAEIMRHGR